MDTAENSDFSRDLGHLHKSHMEANFYVLEKSKSAEIGAFYDIESQKKENMAKKGIEYSTKMRDLKY